MEMYQELLKETEKNGSAALITTLGESLEKNVFRKEEASEIIQNAVEEAKMEGEPRLVEAGDNQKFAVKLKEAMQLSAAQYDVMSRDAYQYGSKKYATSGAVERFVELLNDKI